MYRFITLLFISFLFVFSAKGQEAMSLSSCIDYAYSNHTDIRLAQLNVKDAEWQIKENRAVAYPQLSLAMNYQHFLQQPALPAEALGFGEPGTKIKFALRNNIGASIAYNQLLFNNSYLATIKAAKMYKDYVNIQLNATKEKLRNKVIDAYLPALLLTESVEVLDKNIENQEKLFTETKAINQAGFVEQLDVDRLEYVLSTLRTERESLVRQRDILIDVLKFTINKPVKDELILADDLDKLLAVYGDINPEEELDYMNRPDYVAVLKARELSEIRVNGYRRDWTPTLSFFASYDPSYQGNEKLFFIPSSIAGFRLSMPIYDGGMSKAKQERAIIQALQVDEQKSLLLSAFDLEIQTARNQYTNARQKVADQERNLDLAQRIHDTSQTKFKSGVGSSFEVTQAQSGLYQAQGALVNARYEFLKSIVALRKALGKS
jgi:outer membrane protein